METRAPFVVVGAFVLAAIAAGKDVYLEKPVTHSVDEGPVLTKAVRSSKQVLQCGMQQRSWAHFRDAVDLVQGGSLGRVVQVRTYWWQNYHTNWPMKAVDQQALDWKAWLGSAPEQPFSDEKFSHWRWFWNFGGGAMTDLFTHWIDVVHWAMKADQPRHAQMLADKYVFEHWDCPDTIQAGFRYPGFDVVYEGMMNSSIDDGGIEFRGTDATLKIDRAGFALYRDGTLPAGMQGSCLHLSSPGCRQQLRQQHKIYGSRAGRGNRHASRRECDPLFHLRPRRIIGRAGSLRPWLADKPCSQGADESALSNLGIAHVHCQPKERVD